MKANLSALDAVLLVGFVMATASWAVAEMVTLNDMVWRSKNRLH